MNARRVLNPAVPLAEFRARSWRTRRGGRRTPRSSATCASRCRVGEGPIARTSSPAAARRRRRRARRPRQPATAKASAQMEDPDDLRMLDWSNVSATLGVYAAGTAAEAVAS